MRKGFEENLQKELAEILNTNTSNISNLKSWEGGVEMSFNLMSSTYLMPPTSLVSSANLADSDL